MKKFDLELGHYERIREQCEQQYRCEKGRTYLTQYIADGSDKLVLLVDRDAGICTEIISRDGRFAQFPGFDLDEELTMELADDEFGERVKFGAYIIRLNDDRYLFHWIVRPESFDPGDEDGYGMESEPEIRLYSYFDGKGRFTEPFRLYSIGGSGYYRDPDEEIKVIFLDIDGVLNSEHYLAEHSTRGVAIDPSRLELLRKIVFSTDARIVLTSSWREHWSIVGFLCDDIGKEINRIFHEAGMYIYDKTPSRIRNRYEEILMWLEEHPTVKNYVVIDDEPYAEGALRDRFVLTCGLCDRKGLDESDAEKAIVILNSSTLFHQKLLYRPGRKNIQ